MRELKFRAWTGHEMEHDIVIGRFGAFYVNPGQDDSGLDEGDVASLTKCNTKYAPDTPVMQYTGLKDKNGIEVYEGDIIKADWYPFTSDGYLNYVGVIEYVDHPEFLSWYYDLRVVSDRVRGGACGGPMSDLHGTEIEIIGNIHQHPELLSNIEGDSNG